MRNKFLIFIIFILFIPKISIAEQFRFETTKIEFLENGNIIKATNGKAINSTRDIEIQANIFNYNKNLNSLRALNGIAYYKSENLKIIFDEIILDQKNLISTAKNNVEVVDLKNNLLIKTDLIKFDKRKNIIESSTNSEIIDSNQNILNADKIIYDLENHILKLDIQEKLNTIL